MSALVLRSLAAIALVAACTHTDGVTSKVGKAGATTASANGTIAQSAQSAQSAPAAPAAMPHDSISDRADRGRIMGDSTVSLWVIMASDFQCPYCKQWHDAQFQAIRDYATKGKVRLAFLNMPLSMHPNAQPAAEAAMCASVQNKFWPMHDALFTNQQRWEGLPNAAPAFDSLAAGIGADMLKWRDCMSKHSTLALIQADRDRARQAGVRSTPTFFVGSQSLAGADADVRGAIEAALKGQSK